MANIFERAFEYVAKKIVSYMTDDRGKDYKVLGDYYAGDHRPQLKTRPGQPTDNVYQNFIGLAVDRSVSRLFRGGIEFNLSNIDTGEKDEKGKSKTKESPQKEYLDKIWDLNKKEILLYQLGLHGAVYGTVFVKVSPDYMIDPYTEELYPRLTAIDPEIIRVKTDPQDMERVIEYRIEYKITEGGKETAYKELTKRADVDAYEEGEAADVADSWVIEHWQQVDSAQWELVDSTDWEYPFPPIIHWKNLPSLKSCYGDSDIDDVVNVQDRSNFVVSNTGKIIKHHASQRPVGTGFSGKDMKPLDDSPESMVVIPSPDAKVYMLDGQSDLASSRSFALDLRQSIFDIAREVDMSSVADKLGALTNFGLRVLWGDALDKNDTKRQLYGDAIKELNRRLLVLKNYEKEASDPGEISWGEAMPINVLEEMQADQLALEMQVIDRETVGKRYETRYGVEWETVLANIEAQQKKDNEANDNIGAMILKNFNKGGAGEQPPVNGQTQPQEKEAVK